MKKFIAGIFFLIVIIISCTSVFAADLVYETFDNDTTVSRFSVSPYTYKGAQALSLRSEAGAKFLRLSSDKSNSADLRYTFSSPVTGANIMIDGTIRVDEEGCYRSIYISDGGVNKDMEILKIDRSNTLIFPHSETSQFNYGKLVKNQWYSFRLVINTQTRNYSAYVENELKVDNKPMNASAAGNNWGAGIASVRFFMQAVDSPDGVTPQFCVDYYRVANVTGLSVKSSSPANDESDVSSTLKEINVVFDTPIKDGTMTPAQFLLSDSGGNPVSYSNYKADYTAGKFSIYLNGRLDGFKSYTLTIGTGVVSVFNFSLNQPKNITFTTGESDWYYDGFPRFFKNGNEIFVPEAGEIECRREITNITGEDKQVTLVSIMRRNGFAPEISMDNKSIIAGRAETFTTYHNIPGLEGSPRIEFYLWDSLFSPVARADAFEFSGKFFAGIKLSLDKTTVLKGNVMQASVSGAYNDGTEYDLGLLSPKFTSGDASVIAVTADGIVTAVGVGSTTLSVEADVDGKTLIDTIAITVMPTSISADKQINFVRWRTTANEGKTSTLNVHAGSSTGGDGNPTLGNERQSLIRFDLSSIPYVEGYKYKLNLYGKVAYENTNINDPVYAYAFGADDNTWTDSVTWNTRPVMVDLDVSNDFTVETTGVSSNTLGVADGWVSIDVTEYMEQHLQSDKMASFMIWIKRPADGAGIYKATLRNYDDGDISKRLYISIEQ